MERRQPVDNEFLNISGRQGNMPALNFNFTTARGGVRFFIFLSILYFSGSFFSWFITCNIDCSRREEIQFGQTLKASAAELLGVLQEFNHISDIFKYLNATDKVNSHRISFHCCPTVSISTYRSLVQLFFFS